MSIKSELAKTASHLRSARRAILGRGGEISLTAGLKDLPDAIYKIPADASLAYQVDDSVAYRKIVPSGAEEFAQVSKVGGMTYKTRNLIPFPYYYTETKTINGVTWTHNADGSITANGTQNTGNSFPLYTNTDKPIYFNGTYAASLGATLPSGCEFYLANAGESNITIIRAAENGTKAIENRYITNIRFWISVNTVFDNVTFYPMLNEGTTALPYEPYFDGLRDTKVTELVSEHGNLFNVDNVYYKLKAEDNTINMTSITARFSDLFCGSAGQSALFDTTYINNLMYLTKGIYYLYFNMDGDNVDAEATIWVRTVKKDGTGTYLRNTDTNDAHIRSGQSFIVTEDSYITLRRYTNIKSTISNLMVTRTPRTEYIPYNPSIFAIPEAIQALDGYGGGIEGYPNYIDFERKVFVQNTYRKVFDGTETWAYNSTYHCVLGLLPYNCGENTRLVISNTNIPCVMEGKSAKRVQYGTSSNGIENYGFTTVDEWKAHLAELYASGNPLVVEYALAEPIETDISEYLTDEFIEVEGGGTITAVNEFEYDAPSTINYIYETVGE